MSDLRNRVAALVSLGLSLPAATVQISRSLVMRTFVRPVLRLDGRQSPCR